ncbi:MAG TPA: hypothetical protein VD931_02745, partial [Baekduia sp.]|nr:hypothetical protein [Baekduia sp.]
DHHDHIHVGWQPQGAAAKRRFDAILKPGQWTKLIDRLGTIENPTVRKDISGAALPATGHEPGH